MEPSIEVRQIILYLFDPRTPETGDDTFERIVHECESRALILKESAWAEQFMYAIAEAIGVRCDSIFRVFNTSVKTFNVLTLSCGEKIVKLLVTLSDTPRRAIEDNLVHFRAMIRVFCAEKGAQLDPEVLLVWKKLSTTKEQNAIEVQSEVLET